MMKLETFEADIDSIIVARGRDYHRTGRIGPVEEIAPGLFHADADGTTHYDVDVRMKGDVIVSAACSCPYDRGPYCKHIVATLMKLREARNGKREAPDSPVQATEGDGGAAFPHETYDRVLAYLVDKHDKSKAATSGGKRNRKGKKRAEKALSLAEAADEIEGGLLEFQEVWDDRWSDRRGRYSYEDNYVAMQGVRQVADNVERCDDDAQACLLALFALGYVIEFVGSWDDSDGTAGDEMEHLQSLLADRCERLSSNRSALLKSPTCGAATPGGATSWKSSTPSRPAGKEGVGRFRNAIRQGHSRLREMVNNPESVILRPKAEESPQLGALEIPRSARNDGHGRINHHVLRGNSSRAGI